MIVWNGLDLKLSNFSGNPPTLAVIEWGWVWCEELCKPRRMLSTEPEGWGIRTNQSGEIFWMNNNYNYNGALLVRKSGNIKRFRLVLTAQLAVRTTECDTLTQTERNGHSFLYTMIQAIHIMIKDKGVKRGFKLYRLTCLTRTHVHCETRIMQSSHDSMRQFSQFFGCNVAILDASWASEMIFRPTIHTLLKNRQ